MAGFNFSMAISSHGGPPPGVPSQPRDREVHHHHHHHDCQEAEKTPEKPDRNGFLDLLSSPLQLLSKGGNNNDKQYDKYLAATQAGNTLKG